MALKEVKKPEKAEEQAKAAEEMIKAPPPFAAPIPVKLTPEEEKLSREMDKAYDAVADLSDYSKELEEQLPMDVGYESKKLLVDLEKTKLQEKEVMGELRYKDETADIEKTIKDAQKAEEAGKHDEAVELIKNAKKKMELLSEIIELQRNLAVSGAPSSLIDDVEKSYKFIGTEQEKRGQLILDAGNFYLQYSEMLKSDSNKTAAESFVNYVSALADETKEIDVKKAEKTLNGFYESVSGVTNRNATEEVAYLDSNLDKLNQLHNSLPDGKFKDQVAELMKEMDETRKLLTDEKTRGQVSEDEINRLENITKQTFYMANMISQLESKDAIKQVNIIYGNSLEALLDGKQKEADLHMFTAVEYLANEKDAKYQKDILKKSNDLAAGKINYETAFTFVYSKLYKEAKARKDPELDKILESYPAKAIPKEMGVEQLISLRQGIHISQEVENKLKDAPAGLKPGINQIASNAYAALGAGQLDIVDIQKELMSNYVNVSAEWEKQGILSLSDAIVENPEAAQAAFQYINFSRNISPVKDIEYGLKSGSGEHSVIQSYRKNLEMLEMKLLNGETLSENEIALAQTLNHAAITYGQIIEDPKLGKDIKEKSTELYGNAASLLSQGETEKAMLMFYGASLLPSLTKEERENVISACSGVAEGTYPMQETATLLSIYEEKANNTSDRAKKINYYENKIKKLESKKETLKEKKKSAKNNKELTKLTKEINKLTDEIEQLEKSLKHLKFVQNKLTDSYNTAIEFWNKGDYNSATLVANAAGIQAQIFSLPAKSRKEKDVKAALDYANSLVKDAKTALKDDKTLAKTEAGAEKIAKQLQLHTLAAGYSQLNYDFNKVTDSATKAKYKQQKADYEYVMSKGNEALKLYEEGNKKIEQALKISATDKEAAKALMAEGFTMIESAKSLMLAVTHYNKSVMKIKTKSKEAGRADLLDAMKIYSALGNGHVLDSSGEILLDEKGKPVQMDAKTANMYVHAGQNLLASGIQSVTVQASIVKTKKKLSKQSDKMLKASEVEGDALAEQSKVMHAELLSLNNQLTKERMELAKLSKELKKAKKDKDTAKAAKIGEDILDSKKAIFDLEKQIAELNKDMFELNKATDDISISQKKSKNAKKQAAKENFMGASKSLGSAYGWLACASKTREIYVNKTMLKNDQKFVYGKVGGEVTGIVGDIVGKSAVPDAIADEAEDMLNIKAPGLSVYNSDSYAASIDKARASLLAGNNQAADKVLSDLGITIEQDFDQQQITNHEGAYSQGQESLEWFAMNLPEFFMSPELKDESNIQKKKREDTNALIAEGLKPFQSDIQNYAYDMGLVAAKWGKAGELEVSKDDAIAFENENDSVFQERALAWKVISPQLRFAAAEMSNIDMVDLYSKAQFITKEQTMALLKDSESFTIAQTALENADNFSGYLESPQGIQFAQSILDQNKKELEAMGALSLDPQATKDSGAVMAEWTTEAVFGRMGYKVIWEGGSIAGLEKVSLTNEEILAYENAFTNFENMRGMFTTNLTGGGGLLSENYSMEDQMKIVSAITKASEHYHNANMAILNGEGVASAETYIAKGDAWTKVEHYEVEMGWKGQAKSFMASNIATAPLSVAWAVYDAKKGKMKKEKLTEIEYRQYQFQQSEMKVRMVKLGGDIAITGTLFALTPVTGGTSALAAAGYMTMTSTMGLTEFWHSTGGWQYMTTKEKVLFSFDVGMTVAMAALPVGGFILETAGVPMAIQGVAKEGMQLTKGMQTFAKVVEFGGKGMMYAGIARGLVDAPNIVEGVASGHMSLAEAGLIFANMALPLVQMKLYTARVAKTAKGGVPPEYVYRSKPQQFLEALILGEPIDDPFMHYMAKENVKISKMASSLTPENLKLYNEHIASQNKLGEPLTIPEQVDLLENFNSSGMGDMAEFVVSQKKSQLNIPDAQFDAILAPMSSEQQLTELANFEQFKSKTGMDFQDYQNFKTWQKNPAALSGDEVVSFNGMIIKDLDQADITSWYTKGFDNLDPVEQAFVIQGYTAAKEAIPVINLDMYSNTPYYDVAKAKSKLSPDEQAVWNSFLKDAGPVSADTQYNILAGYLESKSIENSGIQFLDQYLIDAQFVDSSLAPVPEMIAKAKQNAIIIKPVKKTVESAIPLEVPVEVSAEMKIAAGAEGLEGFVPGPKKELPKTPEHIKKASPAIDESMNEFVYMNKPDELVRDFYDMTPEQQASFIEFCRENSELNVHFGEIADFVTNLQELQTLSSLKEQQVFDIQQLLNNSKKAGTNSGEQDILVGNFLKMSKEQQSDVIKYCEITGDSENLALLNNVVELAAKQGAESMSASADAILSLGKMKTADPIEKLGATYDAASKFFELEESSQKALLTYSESLSKKEASTLVKSLFVLDKQTNGKGKQMIDAMSDATFNGVTGEMSRQFLSLSEEGQAAMMLFSKAFSDKKNFSFFTELKAISGEKGAQIAKALDISQDELIEIYTKNDFLSDVRTDLREKSGMFGIQFEDFPENLMSGRTDDYLDFKNLNDDYYLWGMLIDGGLLLELKSMGDEFSVEFARGLWGAYKIEVETSDGPVTLFVKKLDCSADKYAAEHSNKSGHPAPEVYTKASAPELKGQEFEYTNPQGVKEKFGIIQNMKDFKGDLTVSDLELAVSTAEASNVKDIPDGHWIYSGESSFKLFIKELGYTQEAAVVHGFFDRHELNIWLMKLEVNEVKSPLPGMDAAAWNKMSDKQKKIAAKTYLESQGHIVEYDAKQNKLYLHKFGNIDLDTGGYYMMSFNNEGKASFDTLVHRLGTHDIYRVFKELYKKKYPLIKEKSFEQFVNDYFPEFLKGAEEWHQQHSNEAYKDSVFATIAANEGGKVGMAVKLRSSLVEKVQGKKAVPSAWPASGEAWGALIDVQGHNVVIANGERIANEFTLAELANEPSFLGIAKQLEGGKYGDYGEIIIKKNSDEQGLTEQFIEQGAKVFTYQGEEFLFIPPDKLGTTHAVLSSRIIDLENEGAVFKIYKDQKYTGAPEALTVASPTFMMGKYDGVDYIKNDNEVYHVVPWDMLPEDQKTGYPLPLGFPKSKNFKAYTTEELANLPANIKESAVPVKRFDDKIIIVQEGGAAKLGLDPSTVVETGSSKCAEHLLDMTPEQMNEQIWEPTKKLIIEQWDIENKPPEDVVIQEPSEDMFPSGFEEDVVELKKKIEEQQIAEEATQPTPEFGEELTPEAPPPVELLEEPTPVVKSAKPMETEDVQEVMTVPVEMAIPEAAKKPTVEVPEVDAVKLLEGNTELNTALEGAKEGEVAKFVDMFAEMDSAERTALVEYSKTNEELDHVYGVVRDVNLLIENVDAISQAYGVPKEEIVKAYTDGMGEAMFPEYDGRSAVLEKLIPGISETIQYDQASKSILFDILPKSQEVLGGKITGLKDLEGATGAKEITVTTAAGEQKKFYLKLEDVAPENQGGNIMGESGSITPDVLLDGSYLTFKRTPEGKRYRAADGYYISENILDSADVTAGCPMAKIHESGNAALKKYAQENIGEVKKKYGRDFAAALATGTVDRHWLNVWFLKSESKGHTFGNIDLDGGAYYAIELTNDGKPVLGMSTTNPSDKVIKIFMELEMPEVMKMSPEEYNKAFDKYKKEFFAEDSAFMEGVLEWVAEHQNNAEYKNAIIKQFSEYEGEVGIAHGLTADEEAALARGEPVLVEKFAGENGSLFVNKENARPKFISEAYRLISDEPIAGIGSLVEDTPYHISPLEAGETAETTITINGKDFKVEPAEGEVPEGTIVAKRIGENIITEQKNAPDYLKSLGIDTLKTGAIGCFEAYMNLSKEEWVGLMQQAEKIEDPIAALADLF